MQNIHSIDVEGSVYEIRDKNVSNPNILHNGDLQINQRGQAEYEEAVVAYSIDRWILRRDSQANSAFFNVALKELGIKRPNWSTWPNPFDIPEDNPSRAIFMQPIEFPHLYAGKTLTFSADFASADAPVALSIWIRLNNSVLWGVGASWREIGGFTGFTHDLNPATTVMIPDNLESTGNIQAVIHTPGRVRINRIKLELGPVSTLANDPPIDFGKELAICQRYQLKPNLADGQVVIGTVIVSDTNSISFLIPLPATMRISPSIANINNVFAVCRASTGINETGFTFQVNPNKRSNMLLITAAKPAHGLGIDAALAIQPNTILDANL